VPPLGAPAFAFLAARAKVAPLPDCYRWRDLEPVATSRVGGHHLPGALNGCRSLQRGSSRRTGAPSTQTPPLKAVIVAGRGQELFSDARRRDCPRATPSSHVTAYQVREGSNTARSNSLTGYENGTFSSVRLPAWSDLLLASPRSPARQDQINMLSRALDHIISASCLPRDPALVSGGSCASIVESRAALDAHHGNGIKRREQINS
jgi:hypothetical protein